MILGVKSPSTLRVGDSWKVFSINSRGSFFPLGGPDDAGVDVGVDDSVSAVVVDNDVVVDVIVGGSEVKVETGREGVLAGLGLSGPASSSAAREYLMMSMFGSIRFIIVHFIYFISSHLCAYYYC